MPVSGEEPNQKTKSVSYKVPSQVAEQSGQAAEQLPLSLPVKEATLRGVAEGIIRQRIV